jgi:hypothetical protein
VVEVFAGNLFAFMAGLDLVLEEFFAVPFDVTVFGSGNATCAVSYFASYPR